MTFALVIAALIGAAGMLVLLVIAALILHIVDRPARESWAPRLTVEELEITS